MSIFGRIVLISNKCLRIHFALSSNYLDGWKMWTSAEFGSWYVIDFSQYGIEDVETLIDQSFKNTCQVLLWHFLGAHNWFHETEKRKEDEDEVDSRHCYDWMKLVLKANFSVN